MTMIDEAIDKLLSEAESGMSGSTWWEMIDAIRQLQAENKALREGWNGMTLAAKQVQRRHLGTHEGDVYHAMQALHTRHGYNSISRAAIDAALQQEKDDG